MELTFILYAVTCVLHHTFGAPGISSYRRSGGSGDTGGFRGSGGFASSRHTSFSSGGSRGGSIYGGVGESRGMATGGMRSGGMSGSLGTRIPRYRDIGAGDRRSGHIEFSNIPGDSRTSRFLGSGSGSGGGGIGGGHSISGGHIFGRRDSGRSVGDSGGMDIRGNSRIRGDLHRRRDISGAGGHGNTRGAVGHRGVAGTSSDSYMSSSMGSTGTVGGSEGFGTTNSFHSTVSPQSSVGGSNGRTEIYNSRGPPTQDYMGGEGGLRALPILGGAGAGQEYADGGVSQGMGDGYGSGSRRTYEETLRSGRRGISATEQERRGIPIGTSAQHTRPGDSMGMSRVGSMGHTGGHIGMGGTGMESFGHGGLGPSHSGGMEHMSDGMGSFGGSMESLGETVPYSESMGPGTRSMGHYGGGTSSMSGGMTRGRGYMGGSMGHMSGTMGVPSGGRRFGSFRSFSMGPSTGGYRAFSGSMH